MNLKLCNLLDLVPWKSVSSIALSKEYGLIAYEVWHTHLNS